MSLATLRRGTAGTLYREVAVAYVDGSSLQNFKIFRAIGLAFRGWFANFIPVTLLAAVLYAPIVVWAIMLPGPEVLGGDNEKVLDAYLDFIKHGTWALVGISALLAPLLTYRIVQWMNGKKVSFGTSLKYGVRGIIPAVILAGVTNVLNLIPVGGLIAIIITCYWFVAAPAAVAEKLGPVDAMTRSAKLTEGRRGGIFVLNFLMGILIIGVAYAVVQPLLDAENKSPAEILGALKQTMYILIGVICAFQILMGIIQAVSYSLLRTDKDGISNEELATVFD
jgi:hypothetical protein